MKVGLFDFQNEALDELQTKLKVARQLASIDNPQVISFSAPTGAGKTIVMTALFEDIFYGEPGFDAQSDAIILWISDMPELNEQTRLKIEGMSDRIRVRQLVNIDSDFDARELEGGNVYFINTQKLGNDKLLTRQGDSRTFPIWETFTNTAKSLPDRFYVVIDEAHRGMRTSTSTTDAKTIMQRFLLGNSDVGLSKMPMVIGVSATPKRFEELLSGTTHTVHKVYIKAEDVRESGLLKDRILIDYPEIPVQAETTMLIEATNKWLEMSNRWSEYCVKEKEDQEVNPIMVIQVQDGTDEILTKTDLGDCLVAIESVLGRRLRDGEVVHNFNEVGDLNINEHSIRYVEASRIQENQNIKVVFFKLSLSTGWDCPRAEVMMSFRRAEDHTYIAQLLGRMVRTPLARRIDIDANLNDVYLYLPHYNQEAVLSVIEDLNSSEDVPPTETGTSREQVTLNRREGIEEVFEAMNELVTYRVNKARQQSSLRRLLGLARGLTHDKIEEALLDSVTSELVQQMKLEVQRLRDNSLFEEIGGQFNTVGLKRVAVKQGTTFVEDTSEYTISTASSDLEVHFQQAGRLLSNGLHMSYWKFNRDKSANDAKLEVIVLTKDHEGMTNLENFAKTRFNDLYTKYKREIFRLKEQRRKHYERLRLSYSDPQDIPWILSESIDFRRSVNAPSYEKHLYLEDDGSFKADLGPWEIDVINIELENDAVVGWLRNVDRKKWSLEIPYRDGGYVKPMFPDLLLVRKDSKGFLFDILEPHDPSLRDNAAKAVGLAEFAERHWGLFDRIQLIRKKKGADGTERYYRLDMGNDEVRQKVLAVTDNNQLDQIFELHSII
ncbi:DEAD/DEAH box helicase [Bacillus atrophaeus]|uniref:DEAD/DEAH box helicase n=1 Tax=Bacillus atrophaeus TaxID=1452 RepID=UPI00227F17F2|nr:DEAD/DEAH box helicase family protein [Bacillus atrophaeus]MCY8961771.1 DEAD/DEAH box helicase family protein [Bacillus atrophaeus]MCY8965126.1 DEAD/DEAH box helicase family protein [Bacillus atrophaeus]MCY9439879.1 DEAD/DEAH box helicase family protein [Bacillus atrophaeus]MEC0652069.1 DEAD/DEAH box helicase family protein [Bacillus atrophaeus]